VEINGLVMVSAISHGKKIRSFIDAFLYIEEFLLGSIIDGHQGIKKLFTLFHFVQPK